MTAEDQQFLGPAPGEVTEINPSAKELFNADTPHGHTDQELAEIAEQVDFGTYEAVLMGDYP